LHRLHDVFVAAIKRGKQGDAERWRHPSGLNRDTFPMGDQTQIERSCRNVDGIAMKRVGIPIVIEGLVILVFDLIILDRFAGGHIFRHFPTHAAGDLINAVGSFSEGIVVFNVVPHGVLLFCEILLPIFLGPRKFAAVFPIVIEQPVGIRIGHVVEGAGRRRKKQCASNCFWQMKFCSSPARVRVAWNERAASFISMPQVHHVTAFFTGRVQGVGFRYQTLQVAKGFEVSGLVKNLPDGRVQLEAEGRITEVNDFVAAVQERMTGYIRKTEQSEETRDAQYRGFSIL